VETPPDACSHFLEEVIGVVPVSAEPAQHREHRCTMPVDQLQEDLSVRVQFPDNLGG
jgi:hypothetical protein